MEDRIGIIGGSGLYNIEGITNLKEVEVDTPFGKPSDKILTGALGDVSICFLPRHGKGHRIAPHEINYRANIYALKSLGVKSIISVSAVGSMKEELKPGDLVIIDQFYDNTKGRRSTFFDEGIVAHVSFAKPVCPNLSDILYEEGKSLGYNIHKDGTYICMEGPQFSTKGESNIYRKWGVDVIGMTNMPEAKLAREAQICYGVIASITDYDCWREGEEEVTVEMVLKIIESNTNKAKGILKNTIPKIGSSVKECGLCRTSLKGAVMTDEKLISSEIKEYLKLLKS